MRRCYLYPVKSDVRVKLPDYSYSAEGSGRLNFFLITKKWCTPLCTFFFKHQILSLHRCLVLMWKCHYLYYLKIKKINNAFKNQLSNLYQSDIVDTDAEMKVFEGMLKADGYDTSTDFKNK